jgi:hypothetical protein
MHGVFRLVLLSFVCLIFALPSAFAESKTPELPDAGDWLNTTDPVQIAKLRGHFVLLHFGIYSAANADQSVHDLKKLAAKYPGELVVIGVHSVKLFDETAMEDIRRTIAEQSVRYPVMVDRNLQAWKDFKVYALPTVILIAPDGQVIFRKPGGEVLYYVDKILAKRMGQYKDQIKGKQLVFGTDPAKPTAAIKIDASSGNDTFENERSSIDVMGSQPETPAPAFIEFDFKSFIGEKVRIGREYSRRIGTIKVSLRMPPKTHLLSSVKSFVRVFTKEGEVLGGLETPNPEVNIPIDREINTERLYVEAAFYYTREGGLNLFKGLLFEIQLADYSKSENIELKYNVTNP